MSNCPRIKSCFQSKVNLEFHLEIKLLESARKERHRIQIGWGPVWFFPSWGAMSSGYGTLDLIKSKASTRICQDISDLFNDYGVNVCDWPTNSLGLNLTESLWSITKRKVRDKQQWRGGKGQEKGNLGFLTTSAGSLADCLYKIQYAVIHAKRSSEQY